MQTNDRITVKEAASLLGMSEQGVKEHMKRGLFDPPIGYVTQTSKKRKQYLIYRNMVEKFKSIEDISKYVADQPRSQEEVIGELVLNAVRQIMLVASGMKIQNGDAPKEETA